MATTINDYTLKIGWNGSEVLTGINKLENKLRNINRIQKTNDNSAASGRARTRNDESARLALLDKTERKLHTLRIRQARLNKEGRQYKVLNGLIQGSINRVQSFQNEIKSTTRLTGSALRKQERAWISLGHVISATRVKEVAASRTARASGGAGGAAAGGAGAMALMAGSRALPGLAAAFSIYEVGRAALSTSNAYESLNVQLLAAFGNTEESAKQLEYVKDVADRFAVSVVDSGEGWAKMALSAKQNSMAMEDAKTIFEGTTIAISGFGLSADDARGTFRALNQIMSKGQITMEDFKLQIAERMPGAMGTLQKVLGVTSDEMNKMFEQGQIGSEVLIDWSNAMSKMVTESGALDLQLKTIPAAFNRLKTAMEAAAVELFGEDTRGVIINMITLLTKGFKAITPYLKGAGKIMHEMWETGKLLGQLFAGGLKSALALVAGIFRSIFGKEGSDEFGLFVEDMKLYWNGLLIDFYLLRDFLDSLTFDQMVQHFSDAIDAMKKKLKEWVFGKEGEPTISGGIDAVVESYKEGKLLEHVGGFLEEDLDAFERRYKLGKYVEKAPVVLPKGIPKPSIQQQWAEEVPSAQTVNVEIEVTNGSDMDIATSTTIDDTVERNQTPVINR